MKAFKINLSMDWLKGRFPGTPLMIMGIWMVSAVKIFP